MLVTKGDHPDGIEEICASISDAGIEDIVIWDNSQRPDLSCFGRYMGILEAQNEWIYHQDDDLVAPVGEILKMVDPVEDRYCVVANNRADESWWLTAMGTVFHRSLGTPDAFEKYTRYFGCDDDFYRVSDVVFAYQYPYRRVVLPYRDLAWAATPDRMHHQPDHYLVRERARARIGEICKPQMWAGT